MNAQIKTVHDFRDFYIRNTKKRGSLIGETDMEIDAFQVR
jgi:hypothetical protein